MLARPNIVRVVVICPVLWSVSKDVSIVATAALTPLFSSIGSVFVRFNRSSLLSLGWVVKPRSKVTAVESSRIARATLSFVSSFSYGRRCI